jgi:hypothetical protein
MAKRIKIPEIYHDTMSQAIDAAIEYAESKGYGVMTEEESGIIWEPIGYETYQTKLYHIYKENIVSKKCLNISLYRMPSGKYELTTYIN